jgi:ATP-dependent DNA helicase RecQ
VPPDPIEELASRRFGVPYLYPIQRFVISNTLEGKDQIVVLPTGAGKSLCFQIPALVLPGPTLVIVPLLSLLADQLRRLQGTPAAALRGGLDPGEKRSLFGRIRGGGVRILLATPEACLVPAHREELAGCGFSHVVVDEAHCVSEWGRSFRPSYLELGELCARLGAPRLTAFTATASPAVLADVKSLLFPGREVRLVEANPDRPNILYSVVPTLCRLRTLSGLIAERGGAAVVFCPTRESAEATARELSRRAPQREVLFYHAGLTADERQRVELWFLPSRDGVLCSTSAFGLGVDKPDIRTVIHLEAPPSVESYLQETGRAGRDGLRAQAILLSGAGDHREEPASAGPDRGAALRRRAILDYARQGGRCRRQTLLALIGKEAPPCSGCDVCDGTDGRGPEGEKEILRFVRANRRRFRPGRAAGMLCGARGPGIVRGFLDREPGYALLTGWETRDAEEAVRALVARGALRLVPWGPWKGTLTLPRRPGGSAIGTSG